MSLNNLDKKIVVRSELNWVSLAGPRRPKEGSVISTPTLARLLNSDELVGGRTGIYQRWKNRDVLPKLENASDVRELVERVIVELYSGTLHPRIASELVPLMSLHLRAIEAADEERRHASWQKLCFDNSAAGPEQINGKGKEDAESGEPE